MLLKDGRVLAEWFYRIELDTFSSRQVIIYIGPPYVIAPPDSRVVRAADASAVSWAWPVRWLAANSSEVLDSHDDIVLAGLAKVAAEDIVALEQVSVIHGRELFLSHAGLDLGQLGSQCRCELGLRVVAVDLGDQVLDGSVELDGLAGRHLNAPGDRDNAIALDWRLPLSVRLDKG